MSNLQSSASKAQMIELLHSIKLPIMGAGGGFAPIGTINFFDASIAPQGWLACDGTTYNIVDYPDLATYYASVHGSANFYGGNGTTTFAVPDLRGEFLRGTGTNGHTNQGNGANVGVHQDGTEMPFMSIRGVTTAMIWSESTMLETKKEDSKLKQGTTVKNVKLTGVDGETGASTNAITTRPTNTSFLICIKATVSGDANAHQYSTDEQIVGTWIDGKPIYEKTIIGLNIVPSSGWQVLLDINTLSPEKLIDIKLYNEYNSIVYTMKTPDVIQVEDGKIKSYNIVSTGGNINIITIQYTKTQ